MHSSTPRTSLQNQDEALAKWSHLVDMLIERETFTKPVKTLEGQQVTSRIINVILIL